MRDKVLKFCRREQVFRPGEHVVCALSGGRDSVALLHCLLSLRQELQITVSAAHYNHCLRGEASERDEAFVRRLCASWEVPLAVGRGDVVAFAASRGMSTEEAARQLRYGFLYAQPGVIAAAHHAGDQAETVLLNLLRGTGLKGLCAMAPRQDRLARPMLEVERPQVDAYVQRHGLEYREDATNADDDALRNRLRHHVLPLLRQENPNLDRTVARMTGLLRGDEAYLEEQTAALLEQARLPEGWDCRALLQAPGVLRRRAIRLLLPGPKPAMAQVDAVEGLLADLSGSASVELPGGWTARREYAVLCLERTKEPVLWQPVTLVPGQRATLGASGLEILVEGPEILEKSADSLSTFWLKCDMMMENSTICVRPRRSGDRIRLPGGEKSLKRLMIDRKIPAAKRDLLPVITVGEEICAVYGLGTDVRWAARPGDRALTVKLFG